MASVQETVEVDVPVSTAYNQWTQFEEFPEFMQGVEEIRQLGDTELEWTAMIAGKRKHWKARITEQHPDQRVAWESEEGAKNSGVVTFNDLGGTRSRVTVVMNAEPEGAIESAGESLGALERQVKGDLQRFKEFIEERGTETGAWRGEVD